MLAYSSASPRFWVFGWPCVTGTKKTLQQTQVLSYSLTRTQLSCNSVGKQLPFDALDRHRPRSHSGRTEKERKHSKTPNTLDTMHLPVPLFLKHLGAKLYHTHITATNVEMFFLFFLVFLLYSVDIVLILR